MKKSDLEFFFEFSVRKLTDSAAIYELTDVGWALMPVDDQDVDQEWPTFD